MKEKLQDVYLEDVLSSGGLADSGLRSNMLMSTYVSDYISAHMSAYMRNCKCKRSYEKLLI